MDGTWQCALCHTKTSLSASVCSFCAALPPVEGPRQAQKSRFQSSNQPRAQPSASPPSLLTWECKQCFLLNPFRVDRCGACRNLRFGSQANKTRRAPDSSRLNEGSPLPKKRLLHEIGTTIISNFAIEIISLISEMRLENGKFAY